MLSNQTWLNKADYYVELGFGTDNGLSTSFMTAGTGKPFPINLVWYN